MSISDDGTVHLGGRSATFEFWTASWHPDTGISDNFLITGNAVDAGLVFEHQGSRAFLGAPIPEPSTLLLMLAAGAFAWVRRRR